ncbi:MULTISPECIES: alpha/beta hydrolase family esterase [Actinoalloteichus]|uniref:Poly(3-hydroxybutyrate) depolymerase n=1 Tax=Actinoalloteichus fjordicus TaxID=1612552 RepID=A0AAC9LC10_9PSEU|nr:MULTISPECIES: prolyl oligopeptidase family serine peptidase [Actinoalloteichus]APU15013.1 poly(3-hydroxybutyrate) depolymerase [Actinoalloteichus fjordicus]APU21081.1 poly(3-hydroxybutyrate) depolymerase [Actinoalloteichus sp. GBA129-24]
MVGLPQRCALAIAVTTALTACTAPEPAAPPAPADPAAAGEEAPAALRPATDAVTTLRDISVAGTPRSYRLRMAESPAEHPGRPLILVLHGKGGSAAEMERYSGLNAAADAHGVAAAYLQGANEGWGASPQPTALRPDPDADIDFARAVIDELTSTTQIDPDRVAVAGFSEGGLMALRLAAEHPDWFTAAASVAGQLPGPPVPVQPSGPIPLLSVYGDADPLRPIDGLTTPPEGTPPIGQEPPRPTISTADTVNAFCRAGGADEHRHEELPDTDQPDGTSLTRDTCTNPTTGLRVESIVVHGGGHTWPGGEFPNPPRTVGTTSRQLSAADAVVDFLLTSRSRR